MKRKIVLFIGLALLISSIGIVWAMFMFNQTIITESTGGKIVINESDRGFVKYGKYTLVTNTDSFNDSTSYYVYDSVNELYKETPITSSTFDEYVTEGVLYTYDNSDETVQDVNTLDGETMNCYATVRNGYSDEDSSYPYLNEVGFKFKFKSSIDVYLRIEFKDAWKSKKTYITTNTIDERYVPKDKIEGVSPFSYSVDDNSDWIYDELNNCAYYKYIIPATCEDVNDENAEYSSEYSFRTNPEYWYELGDSIVAYREMIIVEVSYSVSIVQANRAEKKWEVNFDALGIETDYKSENS